jgi:hypothetical protein
MPLYPTFPRIFHKAKKWKFSGKGVFSADSESMLDVANGPYLA